MRSHPQSPTLPIPEPLLHDITILDLTRILAGPYCTMTLGDLGAEVIKIEQPGTGDGTRQWGPPFAGDQSAYYLCVNRNKRSLALDLRTDASRAIVRDLARRADVLVENFTVGKMAEWGLDFDSLRQENPALIYASITGYGQEGPWAARPGDDYAIQAVDGLMSITW
jgi:crotonobetainyl-CoA:carnitine CoA-transferase CaiB-like acyl-CoA transferase